MSAGPEFIVLTLKAYLEAGQYVSECVELDVASCGDTLDEAFKNIEDAVEVYLETLDDTGDRERILAERGVARVGDAAAVHSTPVHLTAQTEEFVTARVVSLRPNRAA